MDFGPLLKGAFIGLGKCYLYAHLGGVYDMEVACYYNGGPPTVMAVPAGQVMSGQFPTPGGIIGWLVGTDGKYQLGITPGGSQGQIKTGQF